VFPTKSHATEVSIDESAASQLRVPPVGCLENLAVGGGGESSDSLLALQLVAREVGISLASVEFAIIVLF
jgi:hypothetical protein